VGQLLVLAIVLFLVSGMVNKISETTIEDALGEIELLFDNEVDIKKSIEIASYYALFAISNFAKIYDGGVLERKFIERFGLFLVDAPLPCKEAIHVISISYKSGGHTRLMERLASMHEVLPDLVVTKEANVFYDKDGFDPIFNEVFDFCDFSVDECLVKLVKLFSGYKKVILSIHPDDFVAAVAARVVKESLKTEVYFINHADHLFSFGRTASDCVLEVSAFGEALGRVRCPGLPSSFLGIPLIADWDAIDFYLPDNNDILTSGLFSKFQPKLGYSLPLILKEVLGGSSKVSLSVVGVRPYRDFWWWLLKFCYPRQVRLHGLLPFMQYKNILSSSSFVLDSYPVTGGTAFPEAIVNGKIAFGVDGPVVGYTPVDKLRVIGAKGVLALLGNVSSYRERLIEILDEMEVVHSVANVRSRYLLALSGSKSVNPLLPDFKGDPFFFEKCAVEIGVLNFPASVRRREASELIVELTLMLRFKRYLNFKSFLKMAYSFFQLCFVFLRECRR
jgi:hypothetical protein